MATNTYVAIDKVTVGTATPSVTFSAISADYTDLVIVFECFTTAAGARDVALRFNSDTASNYSSTFFQGNGSAATSTRESSQTRMMIDYSGAGTTASTAEIGIVNIMNYSNATTNKTVLVRANRAGAGTDAVVGLWRNTAAITSVTLMFINGTDNFGVGSVFSLYGILAEGGAKATGGYVTSDSSYYYHTFLASGTFTPLSTLSCDVLVVAGGGGGGSKTSTVAYPAGGGGGAGGLLAFTSQSLSTAQTVTIGGGGAGAATGVNPSFQGTNGVDSQFGSLTLVKGGGGAGSYNTLQNGLAGGSSGGGSYTGTSVAPSVSGQGYTGGAGGSGGDGSGGGGGGAGGAGSAGGTNIGGAGGVGAVWLNSSYYAGGGGGSASGTVGAGGTGGGGAGNKTGVGVAGTANTGGGGGGSWAASTAHVGGAGGSGIVIVRYAK
jgi:hypothetical protein